MTESQKKDKAATDHDRSHGASRSGELEGVGDARQLWAVSLDQILTVGQVAKGRPVPKQQHPTGEQVTCWVLMGMESNLNYCTVAGGED